MAAAAPAIIHLHFGRGGFCVGVKRASGMPVGTLAELGPER